MTVVNPASERNPIGSVKMPPITRSRATPPPKKTKVILTTKARPRLMCKLPLELREMVYIYLLCPRTIEVKFMSKEEAEAHAQAILNARSNVTSLSKNDIKASKSKYLVLDEDSIDTDFRPAKRTPVQNFKLVNTSKNRLVLHAINQETRDFALKRYNHIFKTNSSFTGFLFNFDLDILAFTTHVNSSANERKYQFVDRKSFQADIARIQNLAYLFDCHYKELDKVHRGTPNARYFVTRFPALKKVIITLPLEHLDQCNSCKGGDYDEDSHAAIKANGYINHAHSHFQELKQKLKDAGIEWVIPELTYQTYCFRQKWPLVLRDLKKSS
ncbi:hypothetical protein BKA65DRAFT_553098 [Rhexocercosporidium sp. MPI-PUGE-AT-0058]|nr:hypothetical protein BKA65DRAFT_553098 [Rhexocercosporidium sp. MPI-PUGE-AT-0058]